MDGYWTTDSVRRPWVGVHDRFSTDWYRLTPLTRSTTGDHGPTRVTHGRPATDRTPAVVSRFGSHMADVPWWVLPSVVSLFTVRHRTTPIINRFSY